MFILVFHRDSIHFSSKVTKLLAELVFKTLIMLRNNILKILKSFINVNNSQQYVRNMIKTFELNYNKLPLSTFLYKLLKRLNCLLAAIFLLKIMFEF